MIFITNPCPNWVSSYSWVMELNQDLSYEVNKEEESGSWKNNNTQTNNLWLQKRFLVTDHKSMSWLQKDLRRWSMEKYPDPASCLLFSLGSEVYTGFRRKQLQYLLPLLCAAGRVIVPWSPISSVLSHYLFHPHTNPMRSLISSLWGCLAEARTLYDLPKLCHASKPKLLVYYNVAPG